MTSCRSYLLFGVLLFNLGCQMQKIKPPKPETKVYNMEQFGHVRQDPYYWLREKENPEVLKYLRAENQYAESIMQPHERLVRSIYQEMIGRIPPTESSYPIFRAGYYYQTKFTQAQEHPIFVRRKGSMDAAEELLVDINKNSQGFPAYEYTSPIMSPDQNMMAFGYDVNGEDVYEFEFRNLQTGTTLSNKLKNVSSNLVWAADNKTLFYVVQDPKTKRNCRVLRLNIETGQTKEIYYEKDVEFSVFVYKTLNENHIFIASSSTLSNEIFHLPSDKPEQEPKLFAPREKNLEYSVYDGGDRFYINTNWKAPNFRVMETPYGKTSRQNWKEVVAHRADVFINQLLVFNKHLVLDEMKDGLSQIELVSRENGSHKIIPFPDSSYVTSVSGNVDENSPFLRFVYQSMRQPDTVIEWEFATGTLHTRKTLSVPNFDMRDYKTDRIWVKARDGKLVPVSLLYKNGFRRDGKSAVLIQGYGAYGFSLDPMFDSNVFSLVDRGFVIALAHVRGGSELGRPWYDDGRGFNKKNTFYDFIDVTQHLIRENYASPKRVYAQGGSAGGLLMGAIANIRPDLYRAIIANVPFVDVLTTMLDTNLPLTTGEFDEWGNPAKKQAFNYILSYSPYDNVKAQGYPHILATTGLNDPRVPYWEPAKWIARLRDYNSAPTVSLLKIDLGAGHLGKSGRYQRLNDDAFEASFLLAVDKDAQFGAK